uniref:Uncharacterized protein n=1 Tax=Sphaerodactylus townsendi TaxID=933632 RepID=A0ACB8FFK8_9SAUR
MTVRLEESSLFLVFFLALDRTASEREGPKLQDSKTASFGCVRTGRHVNEHHDQKHHHGQRRKDHRRDLLPRFLHRLLSLFFIFGGLFFGFSFQLSHSEASGLPSSQDGGKKETKRSSF